MGGLATKVTTAGAPYLDGELENAGGDGGNGAYIQGESGCERFRCSFSCEIGVRGGERSPCGDRGLRGDCVGTRGGVAAR